MRTANRPVQLFNVTLEETGEAMVIAPVRLPKDAPASRRDFAALFKDRDIAVATAARLSATFPYVTPQATPAGFPPKIAPAFHGADGGFYDNSGIISAVDLVARWLEAKHSGVR